MIFFTVFNNKLHRFKKLFVGDPKLKNREELLFHFEILLLQLIERLYLLLYH